MRCRIQITFLLYFLVFVYGCQACSSTFHACTTDDNEDGFRCKANDTDGVSKCVSSKYWCTSVGYGQEKHRCGDVDSNLMLRNCFQTRFGHEGSTYVAVRAGASWSAAKLFCEEYGDGFSIASFHSTNEFNDIVTKLDSFIYNPLDGVPGVVVDNFGVMCPKSKPFDVDFHTDAISFWTGGYIDYVSEPVPTPHFLSLKDIVTKKELAKQRREVMVVKDNQDVTLLAKYAAMKIFKCPGSGACVANETRIKFDARKGHWGTSPGAFLPEVDSDWTRASILCERKNIQLPGIGHPTTCLTGFKCPNSDKCLTGALYKDSELCDGVKDCPDGEDENPKYCNSESYNSGREDEPFHFFNLQHKYDTAKRFCESKGWVLPSLRNESDIQKIAELPAKYYSTNKVETPFMFRMHDWDLKSWTIYLGASTDSQHYTDGTPVKDYRTEETGSGFYVVATDGDGAMDTIEENSGHYSVFVCRESRNSPPSAASIAKISCLVFVLTMLNLLLL